jgi:hypothetical protein
MVALALRVQSPGPRTGTSATLKAGVSVPLRTPLETSASLVAAGFVAIGLVTSTYFVALVEGTVFFFGVIFFDVVRIVVVVGVAASVEVVDVDVTWWWVVASGVRGEEAVVNVKTNTTSSSGLDHIKRCALRSEESLRVMVLKRYRS